MENFENLKQTIRTEDIKDIKLNLDVNVSVKSVKSNLIDVKKKLDNLLKKYDLSIKELLEDVSDNIGTDVNVNKFILNKNLLEVNLDFDIMGEDVFDNNVETYRNLLYKANKLRVKNIIYTNLLMPRGVIVVNDWTEELEGSTYVLKCIYNVNIDLGKLELNLADFARLGITKDDLSDISLEDCIDVITNSMELIEECEEEFD